MDQIKVLKRAWAILWRYKALWIFGIILALTTFSWESRFLDNLEYLDYEISSERIVFRRLPPPESDFGKQLLEEFRVEFSDTLNEIDSFLGFLYGRQVPASTVEKAIAVTCALLVLIALVAVPRYVVETALIRMVNQKEEDGEEPGVRQGFRLGWSRGAWRLFLIDVLIDWPVKALFYALTGMVFLAWLRALVGVPPDEGLEVLGVVRSLTMIYLVMCFGFVIQGLISLFKPFFRRMVVLEGLGVFASIRQGFIMVRRNLKDAGLMWLIMVGLNLVWPILMIPVFLLGALVGLLSGVVAASISGWFGGIDISLLWMVIVGLAVFTLVLLLFLSTFNGFLKVFESSAWTLTYRELRALRSLESGDLPPEIEGQTA